MQDVPDPPAVQVSTPELNEVSARFPAVPPEATVVVPPNTGSAAIPHLSGQTTVGSGGTAGNLAMTSLSSGVHSCTAGGSGTSCIGSTTVRITID